MDKILPLIFAFPLPYSINLLRKRHSRNRQYRESQTEAEELYVIDNNLGNLEFDLEKIHRDFRGKKTKLIYVIDELDKIENLDQIKDVLKFFKNLFTLSCAIFIFVGGEKMYDSDEPTEEYRSQDYTYFTSRYFLSRPLWPDLSEFFETITHMKEFEEGDFIDPFDEEQEQGKSEFEKLKRTICFEAKNDFFDLRNHIKNRIFDFDESGRPIIKIEGNFEDDKKVRFHKMVTVLFEGKYMSLEHSKWKENELMLRKLFDYAHKIHFSYKGSEFSDPTEDTPFAEMIRAFNGILYRFGAFDVKSETATMIRGLKIPTKTYIYTGIFKEEPPSILNQLTEFEKRFVNEFKEFGDYILSLINSQYIAKDKQKISANTFWKDPDEFIEYLYKKGYDVRSQFKEYFPIYHKIYFQELPDAFKRESTEKMTKEIISHKESMFNVTPSIIAGIIREFYASSLLKVQTLKQNGSLFGGTSQKIRDLLIKYNHTVVHKEDLTRQAILLNYNPNDPNFDLEEIRKDIRDNSSNHRIILISKTKISKKIKGLHTVNFETPTKFENSMSKLLKDLKNFW